MRLLGYEVIRFVTCGLKHLSYKVIGKGGLHVLPLSISFFVLMGVLSSCEDLTNAYSNREYVRCNYTVASYTELFNVMGNYGQYAFIRKMPNGKVRMTLASTGKYTEYNPDKIQSYFYFGLAGLIVGTNNYGESLCYDLGCPYCDGSAYRLTLKDNGYAKCSRCGITYDLNLYGVIVSIDSAYNYVSKPRALYRYHITYDGTNVSMYN